MSYISGPNLPVSPTQTQTGVQAVGSVAQEILSVQQQYGRVAALFNQALQQLMNHLNSPRPAHPSAAAMWDATADRLSAQVDKLSQQIEALATKLSGLLKRWKEVRADLDRARVLTRRRI